MRNKQRDVGAYIRRLVAMDKSTLPPDGGERFNRLIFAASPYLLQHAENPVDWYPWGEEAFRKAREEDKPVFLSIGYATCHWCHVMAEESFENLAVAQVLNRHYVAIKVDREERPDIDEQYMTVAQLMTGSGGWPLNVVMTPDKRPFFAATYLPVEPRMGMPGIIQVLEKLAELWQTERGKMEENCVAVLTAVQGVARATAGELPGEEIFREASGQLAAMFDPAWGGFGEAPKFPMPHYLTFLLRFWKRRDDAGALAMVEHTLRMMRYGGIFDQLGFGIHRYAVDRQWLVPHFEKMLYDQALVATAALATFQVTGTPFFSTMAEDIFAFVLREMTSPEGGFYAGLDADSEGEEGRYYLWTPAQVRECLGKEAAGIFCRLYDITEQGNFEGRNIPHLPLPPEDFAPREGFSPGHLAADLEQWRVQLLAAREKRTKPFRDEKVLTAWNGLMIAALAKGYAVTGTVRYLTAAQQARHFILERLQTPRGRLLRSWHQGAAAIPGFLVDYAFFVHGLLGLYEATLDQTCLDDACRITEEMRHLFGDPEKGGFWDSGADAEKVLIRQKNAVDGVIPSGNAMAALNLVRLGRIVEDEQLVREGGGALAAFMGNAVKQPAAHLVLLAALDNIAAPSTEVTLAGKREAPETTAMLRTIGGRFIPNLVLRHAGERGQPIADKPVAFICSGGACRPPVYDAESLGKLLDEGS
jgi:uncharacterized protein YyaL (SSP411 family)